MIVALLGVLAAAADLPLAILDAPLVGDGVRIPPATEQSMQARFVGAVRVTWPDAVAAGETREGGPVSASADPIVHVGLRVTRFEETRFAFGTEKTVEVLRATVAPFAVDLGTGEVIASAPYSVVVSGERLGTNTRSDASTLRSTFVDKGVPRAVTRFAKTFAPDRLATTVLDKSGDGSFVARGVLDGSFVGERWRSATGEILEVVETGDRVSRVVSPTGGPLPRKGATLVRPGLARPLGKAPRVLVAPPGALPGRGPDAEAVTMWVEEALAQAGWVVVPRGTELFGEQLRASSRLDIPEEALLNAQTPPERVAVPRVWRLSVGQATEPGGNARLDVTAALQVDVYDLATGLIVQSIPAVETTRHDTRVEVVDDFAAAMRVSTVKDATLALAADPQAFPSPALPAATLDKVRGDGVAWTATDAPIPAGVIGEVRRPRVFESPEGVALDGPAARIGVARVLGLRGKRLEATWLAPGSARAGDRFVAVGGRQGSPPVRVEPPRIEGEDLPRKLDEAAVAGLHQAPGLAVVAWGADADRLDGVVVRVASSGFAGAIERAPIAATRRLETRFRVAVRETTKGRKQLVTVRVDAEAQVFRDGQIVLLKPPSAKTASETYTMWTEQTVERSAKAGPRDLTVVDLPGTIAATVHQTAVTLGERVAVMIGDG